MLRQRLIVAALFLPLFTWLIFLPATLPFFAFCVVGLAVAVLEMGELIRQRGLRYRLAVNLPAVLALGLVAGFPEQLPPWANANEAVLAVLVAALLVLGVLEIFAGQPESGLPSLAANVLAILILGGIGSFVFKLRRLPDGAWWITLLFGFNWLYDAGAYFGGSWFGRRKLAPGISPHKTVEGVAGGLGVNLVAAAIFFPTLLPPRLGFTLAGFLGLALGLGALAQAGDLLESLIKRWSGRKDSAGLIPGHGGVLDKFDSAFFTAPVLYLIARLLLHA